MRREQPERMSGVHHQSLFVGHSGKVLHREPVLCPILEYRAVATVGNKLVRMLRHRLVEVVVDHQHDCRRLA